jgi:hypothetical protein
MSIFAALTFLTGLVTAPLICWHSTWAFVTWLVLWAVLVRFAHRSATR